MKKIPVSVQYVFDENGPELREMVLSAFRLWLQHRLTAADLSARSERPDSTREEG